MRGQCHAPADFYPRERPGTHCTGGWVGPRAGLHRKISPPLGFDPWTVQPIAGHNTDWATTGKLLFKIIVEWCVLCWLGVMNEQWLPVQMFDYAVTGIITLVWVVNFNTWYSVSICRKWGSSCVSWSLPTLGSVFLLFADWPVCPWL
jgi:hypothetical protein